MDGRTDRRTDGETENCPILQDFVPYRGRCPATAQFQPQNCIKQGKGTADHMMPLGDWLYFCIDLVQYPMSKGKFIEVFILFGA